MTNTYIPIEEYTHPETFEKGILIGHSETGVFLGNAEVIIVAHLLVKYIQENINPNITLSIK